MKRLSILTLVLLGTATLLFLASREKVVDPLPLNSDERARVETQPGDPPPVAQGTLGASVVRSPRGSEADESDPEEGKESDRSPNTQDASHRVAFESFVAHVVEGRELAEAAYLHLGSMSGYVSELIARGLMQEPSVVAFPKLWRRLEESSATIELRPYHGESSRDVDLSTKGLTAEGISYRFRHEGIEIMFTVQRGDVPADLAASLSGQGGARFTGGGAVRR